MKQVIVALVLTVVFSVSAQAQNRGHMRTKSGDIAKSVRAEVLCAENPFRGEAYEIGIVKVKKLNKLYAIVAKSYGTERLPELVYQAEVIAHGLNGSVHYSEPNSGQGNGFKLVTHANDGFFKGDFIITAAGSVLAKGKGLNCLYNQMLNFEVRK